jgi:hypothetical protein
MRHKTAHFSLRLDPKLKADAQKAAAADQRPLGSLIGVLLSNHCRDRTEANRLSKRGGRDGKAEK